MIKKRHFSQQGFTLIELLIVMAIIAMLAAIVGPRIIGSMDGAQRDAAKGQIALIEQAIDTYRLDVRRYPTNLQGLMQNDTGNARWNGPYLKKAVPLDPWDLAYHYQVPGSHGNDYDLYSYGSDGQEGGEGKNVDIINW